MTETLLLTATINPGNVPAHVRDPVERMLQYVTSLLLWVQEGPFDQIVFCENSNYDLEPIRKIASSTPKKVEIISFAGNKEAQDRGKGSGEAEIIEKAFSDSKLIRQSWSIWKVTGRLYVPNAAAIREVHKDHRHVMTSDTRYFKISPNFFWCHLYPLRGVIDDRRGEGNMESVYGHGIAPLHGNGYLQVFREPITFIGQGGGSGMWYGQYPEWAVTEAKRLVTSPEPRGSAGTPGR